MTSYIDSNPIFYCLKIAAADDENSSIEQNLFQVFLALITPILIAESKHFSDLELQRVYNQIRQFN